MYQSLSNAEMVEAGVHTWPAELRTETWKLMVKSAIPPLSACEQWAILGVRRRFVRISDPRGIVIGV